MEIQLIQQTLNGEDIQYIIPLNSKKLDIPMDDYSTSTGLIEYLVILALCLVPTFFLMGIFGFILMDLGGGNIRFSTLLMMGLFILTLFIYFTSIIYERFIKSYPSVVLIITDKDLYYFLLNQNYIKKYNSFDLEMDNLGSYFFGDVNADNNKMGEKIVIEKDGDILLKGRINIKDKALYSPLFKKDQFIPLGELRELFLQ